MTFASMRAEYERTVIGSEILGHVTSVVRTAVVRYPPRVYTETGAWNEDEVENVVQEVVTGTLLAERQIDYLFDTSDDEQEFDALLRLQISRTLGRTRRRTVIDNLIPRCMDLLHDGDYRVVRGTGRDAFFAPPDRDVSDRRPTDSEVRVAVGAARAVPQLRRRNATERASPVYDTGNLALLLKRITSVLPTTVGRPTLQRILEDLLTDWLATLLVLDDRVEILASDLNPSDDQEVKLAVQTLTTELTDEQKAIFSLKREGTSDQKLSERMNISRPTLANRKAETFEVIRSETEHLGDRLTDHVLDHLYVSLNDAGEHDDA